MAAVFSKLYYRVDVDDMSEVYRQMDKTLGLIWLGANSAERAETRKKFMADREAMHTKARAEKIRLKDYPSKAAAEFALTRMKCLMEGVPLVVQEYSYLRL